MPLQIRRGTNAERLSLSPTTGLVEGEVIYVTDEQRLYVGTGLPGGHQGIPVTNITVDDAKDAAAAALIGGTHQSISFTYNNITSTINAVVDLSNYQGLIRADALRGSLFADDSSLLVDGMLNTINLSGTIKDDVYPADDQTYNLGTVSQRFKDLYLSGNSIYLGDAVINSIGSAVNLPDGSLINGVPISSGYLIPGSNYNINIVADDSTLLIDSSTGTINLTETIRDHVSPASNSLYDLGTNDSKFRNLYLGGDTIVLGLASITESSGILNLGSDLSLATNNIVGVGNIDISGSISNGSIFINNNNLTVENDYLNIYRENSTSTLIIRQLVPTPANSFQTIAITGGPASCANEVKTSRGTIETPTTVQVGDSLSYINIQEGYDGSNYILSSGIAAFVDDESTVSLGSVPGKIIIATYADGVTPKGVVINSKGWVSINNVGSPVGATLDINGFAKLAILTAEPTSPANGMVAIADGSLWNPTSTGKQTMVVRLGGAWVQMAVAA